MRSKQELVAAVGYHKLMMISSVSHALDFPQRFELQESKGHERGHRRMALSTLDSKRSFKRYRNVIWSGVSQLVEQLVVMVQWNTQRIGYWL